MAESKSKLARFEEELKAVCKSLGRHRNSIELIAISKFGSDKAIRKMTAQGQFHFGERRIQEAQPKLEALKDLPITWHFIGNIQSNKMKQIVKYFHVIHSVNSLKTATLLNQTSEAAHKKLAAFIQVNLNPDPAKAGFDATSLMNTLPALLNLRNIHWQGLMTMAPHVIDPAVQFNSFEAVRLLQVQCNHVAKDTFKFLSMGMTEDWREALRAGATHLRIGRALFGD